MAWYVLRLNSPLQLPRYLAKDIDGYHTTSFEWADRYRTKKAAETAKTAAGKEWPEAEFLVVPERH